MPIDSYKKAGFFSRLFALLIDLVIFFGTYFFLRFFHLENLTIFLFIFYFSYLNSIFGQTLGKKILKIKVVDKNLKTPSLFSSFIREISKFFISPILLNLGFLWMIIDKDKQTWHDKIAKTYVIRLNKDDNPIFIKDKTKVNEKIKVLFFVSYLTFFLIFTFPLFYIFLFEAVMIKGSAMEPNYKSGQYYLIKKFDRNFRKKDVIVFHSPKNKNIKYIKRIIGLPGDMLMIKSNQVYINGKKLDENYIKVPNSTKLWDDSLFKEGENFFVPQNKYFVLGDNRETSFDSRGFGFVDEKDIIGKIWFCYYNCN